MDNQITYSHSRNFPQLLSNLNINVAITSYSRHNVICLGTEDTVAHIQYLPLARPMGIALKNNQLQVCSLGNIIRFEDQGEELHENILFTRNFYPQSSFMSGDYDAHDISINDKDDIFVVSATFNAIIKPSYKKSFEVYWVPPWITQTNDQPPCEDRCHLNGLCLEDNKPRYVTAICQKDYAAAWREHMNKGVVYDIKTKQTIAEGLWSPHSPTLYNDQLWILESGTEHLGHVDPKTKTFHPKKFFPGFLRGLTFHDKYAFVCTSHDRHDTAFNHLPLGGILKKRGQKSKSALFIIDMETPGLDIIESFEFTDEHTELYDVEVIPNSKKFIVFSPGNPKLSHTFFL